MMELISAKGGSASGGKEPKPTKASFTLPQIPEEAKKDPARLLRFLLDKDAEDKMYQKS
jgi:hypothetical protein